jgi:K+-transporting ATPase ATPase A chain
MTLQIWLLPIAILVVTTILAIPLSRYLAWIMNGQYKAPRFLHWFEERLDSGPQNWKQYTVSILLFNTALFVFGFAILSLQPWLPLNPDGKGMLAPTTIFHTVVSFMTNTDLQHYSGDQVFSNFSQIFFGLTNFFLSASIGFCGLTAIIRAFRSDSHVGNFFVDMWRVVVYMFLPISFLLGIVFLQQGSPMTYQSSYHVSTLESGAMGTRRNHRTLLWARWRLSCR